MLDYNMEFISRRTVNGNEQHTETPPSKVVAPKHNYKGFQNKNY